MKHKYLDEIGAKPFFEEEDSPKFREQRQQFGSMREKLGRWMRHFIIGFMNVCGCIKK